MLYYTLFSIHYSLYLSESIHHLKKYFTRPLLYNFLIAIGITVFLLVLVNWGLRIYTRHGQTLMVPDVKGKKYDDATDILEKNHLDYAIMDSAYMPDKPPFSVIEQNPKPETVVKSGRMVYLTVNASGAPLADVPDLVGKSSYKYARIQLEGLGFNVAAPIYKPDPHRDALLAMKVDGRPLKKGAKVRKGSTITLVLGQGLSSQTTSTPYLIGLHYDEAMVKIKEEYHLSVGAVTSSEEGMSDADRASAFVYRQSPAYGRKVHVGEEIDLWIAKEMPEGITIHSEYYNKDLSDSTGDGE
jgi:beta-lactam-binding protein with PASTA domain